jgi:hypothetical protein
MSLSSQPEMGREGTGGSFKNRAQALGVVVLDALMTLEHPYSLLFL